MGNGGGGIKKKEENEGEEMWFPRRDPAPLQNGEKKDKKRKN